MYIWYTHTHTMYNILYMKNLYRNIKTEFPKYKNKKLKIIYMCILKSQYFNTFFIKCIKL